MSENERTESGSDGQMDAVVRREEGMLSDIEVSEKLTKASEEITSVCIKYGVYLTNYGEYGIHAQHVQKHKSGDDSVRAIELTVAMQQPF